MKKQLWMSLFLLILIAIIFIACATAAQPTQAQAVQTPVAQPTEPPAEASNNTTLLFLGNQNIAPVVFLDGTTPTGVAVDIVSALATHMPQPIEIKAMNWSEAQALVARGDADALIQINPTEERKKVYDFSDPLLESHFSIFTRADRMGISGISSLRHLRVGVESGGLPQRLLEKDPQVQLIIIPNFTEGFRQLNEGSVDAVVVDYRVGSYILAVNNIQNIKISGEPIESSYSSFAVKKGNTRLLNEINTALQIIKADGTYKKIIDKWQPKETVFETRQQIIERNYLYIILFLLLLFLIAGIWMVTIKKELTKRKTAEKNVREQYSTLRCIIDGADALIYSVDRHYRYTSFNRGHTATMKALYGAEIEPGHSILEYITVTEDRETARHNLDRALAGEPVEEEVYSGEELQSRQYFLMLHSPIRSEEEIIGVAVLAQDITGRKQAEMELARVNRALRMLSDSNQALVHITDEAMLMNEICRIAVDVGGYRMAWIGFAEQDEAKTLRPVAHACVDSGYIESARVSWADSERGRGPGGVAIRTGQPSMARNISVDPAFAPWRAEAMRRGYQSIIALPLTGEGRTLGALGIYAREADAFDSEEVKILTELADDLAFGITALRMRARREQAEEALRENEEKFRLIFENSMDGIFLTSPDGSIQSANPAACAMLQRTEDEIVRLGRAGIIDPTDPRLPVALQERERTGRFEGELTFIRKDGTWFPGEITTSVFTDRNNRKRTSMIFRDITERKRAEDALRKSGQEWQTTFNAITDAVFLLDDKGRIIRHNRAFETATGKPAGEIDGRYCFEVMHGTAYPVEGCPMEKAKKSRQRENLELKIGNRWFIAAVDPVFSDNGEISGGVHLLIDITERKLAEEALQESEKRFRNIFTYAAEGILIADISTQEFLYANPAICTMLGYSAQELNSMGMRDIHPEKDLAHVQEVFMEQARAEKTLAESIPVLRKDGAVLYMDIRTTPVIIDGHRCNIGMFTDITERRRMENALQLARSKINMLNTVTFQDIQNASFAISAYHELLRTHVTDEKVKAFLEKQRDLNQKIANSLDFAKNYQDMGVKPPRWQNIGQVFLMAISHLDFLHITRNLLVEDLEVYADHLLEMVFFHLMQNVLNYGQHATVVTIRYQENPDGLTLFIEDNGIGIPPAEKHMIFDRGYGKSTGLGLFFVREVLSITDMTIKETGEPGKGARFEILVPKEGYRISKEQPKQ